MKYEAMDLLRASHSVRKMAKVLGVKEPAFYQWKKRQKANEEKRARLELLTRSVRYVFEDNERVYGYRKMTLALAEMGVVLSEYRVRQIMLSLGLYPESYKKFKPPGSKKTHSRYLDNLFNQDFSTTGLNQKWAGDITYIKTKVGWVYMAAIIDLHNREIVGWEIAKRADTELVCRALSYALLKRNVGQDNQIVFHCDRGIQYASRRFQSMLKSHKITGSMSRAGCPFDNAPIESFFSIAKRERIYRRDYNNIVDVKRDLIDYIEVFYNRKRIQTCLGGKSPARIREAIEMRRAA